MPDDSEFRIYEYIRKILGELGWDTRNPSRGGEVYTQNEFYGHDSILTETLKRKKPENIILIRHNGDTHYWIVEAKRSHNHLSQALDEAKKYADEVNVFRPGTVRFATGIAGSPEDSFLVETHYWTGSEWKEITINNYKTTGFLSKEQCENILRNNSPAIALFDDDPDRFLKKANDINKTLEDSDFSVESRAKVMAALLLALADDGNMRIHTDPTRMTQEVNSNIQSILRKHGKSEFADVICLSLPATPKNHKKFRKGIVETLDHLRAMNVRSAINSGDDSLGKFYETFLKYANGAKEMGIVLTPRHITKMAVEVLGIDGNDRVFDPTCGTGGFLVAAMDHVREKDIPFETFKKEGVWGVESEDPVYGLALVNMIFRGDGQSGLQDGNCFDHQFWYQNGKVSYTLGERTSTKDATRPFTRVLMNPPFKRPDPETKFVDHALEQCQPGALLFAVLPYVCIGSNKHAVWRIEALKRHTLKAVIKFEPKLFYPAMERTYGVILEAHRPHEKDDKVFMSYLFDDNSRPRLSKMLSQHSARDNVKETTEDLRKFMLGVSIEKESIPRERIVTKLRFDSTGNPSPEGLYEPQTYIKNEPPRRHPDVRGRSTGLTNALARVSLTSRSKPSQVGKIKSFPLLQFVEDVVPSPMKNLKDYAKGDIPVVSSTLYTNGIVGWKDVPNEEVVENLMSIARPQEPSACQAFWHPYRFSAINTVFLVKIASDFSKDNDIMLYLSQQVTDANAWRFDYARTVNLDELEVYLPINADNSVNFGAMKSAVQQMKI